MYIVHVFCVVGVCCVSRKSHFLHTIYHVIHESIFATPLSLHWNKTSTRVPNTRCALFFFYIVFTLMRQPILSRETFKISCSVQMLHKITQMWRCVVSCLCVNASIVDAGTIHVCHRLPFHLIFLYLSPILWMRFPWIVQFQQTIQDKIWHWTEHLIKQRILSIYLLSQFD